jgi:hypothetical protein
VAGLDEKEELAGGLDELPFERVTARILVAHAPIDAASVVDRHTFGVPFTLVHVRPELFDVAIEDVDRRGVVPIKSQHGTPYVALRHMDRRDERAPAFDLQRVGG